MTVWNTGGRPVYGRLPQFYGGYGGNAIADAVTAPWDALLLEAKETLDTFAATYLDPTVCPSDWLDWLGQLVGFTGEYWSPDWDDAIKRELIAQAHTNIWPHKGTRWLLEYLFALHQIPATVRIPGEFLAGVNVCGDALGGDRLTYMIVFDHSQPIQRNDAKWRLAVLLDHLYMPAWCDRGGIDAQGSQSSGFQFDQFIAGYSVAGDRIFAGG